MRKWLSRQTDEVLFKVAHDCGYERYGRAEAIAFIVEYAKSYGLRQADFQARYQYTIDFVN
jgi:hypothetical protein